MHRRSFLGALALSPLLVSSLARPARAQGSAKLKSIARDALGTTLALGLDHAPFRRRRVPRRHGHRLRAGALPLPGDDEGVAVLVHFHGHNTTAERAMAAHQLREQLADSRQNALLVVPQLAVMAADSSCGKLESPGGLARMLAEAVSTTRARGVRRSGTRRSRRDARPRDGVRQRALGRLPRGGLRAASGRGRRTRGVSLRRALRRGRCLPRLGGRAARTSRCTAGTSSSATSPRARRPRRTIACSARSSSARASLCAEELQEGELSRHDLSHAEAVFVRTGSEYTRTSRGRRTPCATASTPPRCRGTWPRHGSPARPARARSSAAGDENTIRGSRCSGSVTVGGPRSR